MKIMRWLTVTVLTGLYIFMGVVIYWLFWPYQVIEYKDKVLPLKNHQVASGELLEISHNFCKYISVPLKLTTEIQDGVIFALGITESNTAKGCYNRVAKIVVPTVMGVGEKARVHYTLFYQVNPLRTITYDLYSEEFEIISKDLTIKRSNGRTEDIQVIK